jgi:hypothetical protein
MYSRNLPTITMNVMEDNQTKTTDPYGDEIRVYLTPLCKSDA